MTVTGERVVTFERGFNPTYQRHRAQYALCERFLGPGRLLDLGCGIGHSFDLLAPRETVGVDKEPSALAGQARETHTADMRELPFPPASFQSSLSVQSIEHVPDPERVLAEVNRVLQPDGTAVFVTPNRLTFARADEIIDPYHYVEFDAEQLRGMCAPRFADVDLWGLYGSERYLELLGDQADRLNALLRRDPLRLRRLIPRRLRQRLYDRRLTQERRAVDPREEAIEVTDFRLERDPLEEALDVVAVCRKR
ncbi:MAG: class I SAM-dependent methyltransferase [Thermoleophilaceae bacterium]